MPDLSGLSSSEAESLLKQYGLNQLPSKKTDSILKLLVQQFKSILTWLLITAGVISLLIGNRVDAALIFFILLLNSFLSFWQEYKASKELEALRKLEVQNTRVIRDGKETRIEATLLVPGDLIILEPGDKVPADAKVCESQSLLINEASLTGESVPVLKSTDSEDNQIYFGTVVVSGRGKAKVTLTSTSTRFGKIALTLANVEEEPTPLEVSLAKLARTLGFIAIATAVLLFAIKIAQGENFFEVFFTSTALMVAAVPEGLPAIITIILAIGVRRMYKAKTLVRRMSAIESLGAATVICTDKTGTLTKNEMRVQEVHVADHHRKELEKCAIICNSASLVLKQDSPRSTGGAGNGTSDVLGDSTEGALLYWVKDLGLDYDLTRKSGKLLEELPFNLEKRRMSVLWEEAGKKTLYTKGAPEKILPLCKFSSARLQELDHLYKDYASKGLRVLAFAKKDLPNFEKDLEKQEHELEFLGFIAIADEVREEVKESIQKAKKAGILTVMITGDNELTARSVALQVGLINEGEDVLSGEQLTEMTDDELDNVIASIRVFARTIPEQKLRIIQSLQRRGEVVAVTGDGVNDSLALKQAHVGVAMGITGTDVAKEASDIIILDDNYATIVKAIEQGRVIYSNIVKVTKFLLAGNLSEILVILIATLAGFPTPLLAVQILWVNFVTDGLPALALAADHPSKHIMSAPPRDKSASLLNLNSFTYIFAAGSIIAILVIESFIYSTNQFGLTAGRAVAFSTLVVFQMIFVFVLRRHHSLTSNKYLLASVLFVILAQLAIVLYPPLQQIFKIS